jgi:hypothetical protein
MRRAILSAHLIKISPSPTFGRLAVCLAHSTLYSRRYQELEILKSLDSSM